MIEQVNPDNSIYSNNPQNDRINSSSLANSTMNNNEIINQLNEMGYNTIYSKRIFNYYHPKDAQEAIDYLSFENGKIQHIFVKDRNNIESNLCYLCGEEKDIHLADQINDSLSEDIKDSIIRKSFLESRKRSKSDIKNSNNKQNCPCCEEDFLPDDKNTLKNCGHSFCNECWYDFLSTKIKENKLSSIKCMEYECNEKLDDDFIINILNSNQDLIDKYKKFKLELEIINDPNRKFCPFPNCNSFLELKDKNNNEAKCTNGHIFCFLCLKEPHGNLPCKNEINKSMAEYEKNNFVKKCPKCDIITEKITGCNHITCSKCGYQWCWLCNGEYDPEHFYEGKCRGLQFFRPKDENEIKLAQEGKLDLPESQRQDDLDSDNSGDNDEDFRLNSFNNSNLQNSINIINIDRNENNSNNMGNSNIAGSISNSIRNNENSIIIVNSINSIANNNIENNENNNIVNSIVNNSVENEENNKIEKSIVYSIYNSEFNNKEKSSIENNENNNIDNKSIVKNCVENDNIDKSISNSKGNNENSNILENIENKIDNNNKKESIEEIIVNNIENNENNENNEKNNIKKSIINSIGNNEIKVNNLKNSAGNNENNNKEESILVNLRFDEIDKDKKINKKDDENNERKENTQYKENEYNIDKDSNNIINKKSNKPKTLIIMYLRKKILHFIKYMRKNKKNEKIKGSYKPEEKKEIPEKDNNNEDKSNTQRDSCRFSNSQDETKNSINSSFYSNMSPISENKNIKNDEKFIIKIPDNNTKNDNNYNYSKKSNVKTNDKTNENSQKDINCKSKNSLSYSNLSFTKINKNKKGKSSKERKVISSQEELVRRPKRPQNQKIFKVEPISFNLYYSILITFIYLIFGHFFVPINIYLHEKKKPKSILIIISIILIIIPFFFIQIIFNLILYILYKKRYIINGVCEYSSFLSEFYKMIKMKEDIYQLGLTTFNVYHILAVLFLGTFWKIIKTLTILYGKKLFIFIFGFILGFIILPLHIIINPILLFYAIKKNKKKEIEKGEIKLLKAYIYDL